MGDIDEPWVVDKPPSERFPIYTRANVGEVYPNPARPFSWATNGGATTERRSATIRVDGNSGKVELVA